MRRSQRSWSSLLGDTQLRSGVPRLEMSGEIGQRSQQDFTKLSPQCNIYLMVRTAIAAVPGVALLAHP